MFNPGDRVQGSGTTRARATRGTVWGGGNGWITVDWDDPDNDVMDRVVWTGDIRLLTDERER